jgi:AbrB family looped-hinge helix DNA binding protein
MAKVLESKLSTEGRVSIPADVRHRLGLEPGDRVQFLVDDMGVRLVTARTLAEEVWVRNTGGDAADAVDLVDAARQATADRTDRWADGPAEDAPAGSGDAVLAVLFPAA